jgi:hypothetical protein
MVTVTKDTWFNNVGDHFPKDPLDDIRAIDLDINDLVAKFMRPIDLYRSHVSPVVNGDLIQADLSTSSSPSESRCHTFYRMLGLPTISPDGSLISPGFPLKDKDHQKSIDGKIPDSVKKAISDRENGAQYRTNLFSARNGDTSVFGLSLATPNGQRKFSIDVGSLDDITLTPQAIPARTQYINRFFQNSDGSAIVNKFETVSHPLAPFITDLVITSNVEPKSGSNSVLVGQPFLDKKDLEYESGKYAKRPGLEFIIRTKLRESNVLQSLLTAAQTVVPNISTQAGLIGVGISEDDAARLFQEGLIDVYTVNDLFKTYKGLINVYYNAVKTIADIGKDIIWIPMPNEGGPESGSVVNSTFVVPSYYLDSWEIERRLSELKVKSLLAKTQVDIGTNDDNSSLVYGDFTISEFSNVANTFENDLADENSKRSSLEAQGSDALRIIEIIGGEVSGLGLIDIIAIYLSLWALDVPTLLNLIDDSAAARLNSITELANDATQNRVNSPGNSVTAYETLTSAVSSLLQYGDYIFDRLKGSPKDGGIGDVRNKG